MGVVTVGGQVKVGVDGRAYAATAVDAGNPHAVAIVDSLAEAGELRQSPDYSESDFPEGVNVEFLQRVAPNH